MFADNDACSTFAPLTIDEIRWLNASQAFDDGDSVHSLPAPDLVKSHSIAVVRPQDMPLLNNFFILFLQAKKLASAVGHEAEVKIWLYTSSKPGRQPATVTRRGATSDTPPSSSIVLDWSFEPRTYDCGRNAPAFPAAHRMVIPTSQVTFHSLPIALESFEVPVLHFSLLVGFPVYNSDSDPDSSSHGVSPTYPHSSSCGNESISILVYGGSTAAQPVSSDGESQGSPRAQSLVPRPKILPITRERSGSQSSSVSTTSTSSLPRTPPSPSIYSHHSFSYPHPDTRSTTPTKSILTLTPKRSPSISTKESSGSKSVTFDEVPAVRFTGDRVHVGDGKVRGEEWNSHTIDGGVDCMGFDMEGMDLLEGRGTQTPTPLAKNHSGSLKRFLTLRRTKTKPRPEISGPYALAPSSPTASSPPQSPLAANQLSSGSTPSFASKSSSFLVPGNVGIIPSSPNGGPDLVSSPKYKPKKPSSLIGPGDLGVLPDHGRFLSNKFYSHPARFNPHKPSSIASSGSVGLLASEPALHALPSLESFRSERSAKSTRSYRRLKDWLGRIGIGVTP
ncbi:hypothetical protein MSAN_00795500 [Mycena sanguinolenta]|uniref:Uncharacterized protein n=1 Tax=Mycena sanguinolenta TaxID=230812 RepID=A0A8H7DC18_9AGAR|nr:hypothetical protein MSAN_00795500 [Mycena sanguinolenta]